MANVLANSLGALGVDEFGVTTDEQLNELRVYLTMIKQATVEYRTFSERAKNLFTFNWSEMGAQKTNSATTSLDNILDRRAHV